MTIFQKGDKRRLYWLMDMYLSSKIDAWSFCKDYHESYGLELDSDTLTDLEKKLFYELNTIAGRFTDIEEDLKNYPGMYFTEEQLKQKIIEIKKILEKEH